MIEKIKRDYSKEGSTVLAKPSKPIKLKWSHKNEHNQHYSFYRCNCGTEFVARESQIKSGKTSSCGCFAKKVRAHNIQKKLVAKHIDEIKDMSEVKKRKFVKAKYSKVYAKILLELESK